MMVSDSAIAILALSILFSCVDANSPQTTITISGVSSGAAMATQMHFAFSDDITGCGVLAGPRYYCAGGLLSAAACMTSPVISISIPVLERKLKSYENDGSIDSLANIKDDPVYIFSSEYDPIALPDLIKLNEKLYSPLGTNLKTNYDMPATHGIPTETFGGKCAIPNLDNYINNCNFSSMYDVMNYLHGGNLIKPEPGFKTSLVGQMLLFNQDGFIHPPPLLSVDNAPSSRWIEEHMSNYIPADWNRPTSGLFNWTLTTVTSSTRNKEIATRRSSFSFDDNGFVYFPSACSKGRECSIHVALHECKQGFTQQSDGMLGLVGIRNEEFCSQKGPTNLRCQDND